MQLEWLIETHAHADHLSAAPYIQEKLGGKIGIGEHIREVQDVFGKVFNEGTEFRRDGSQFDRLFKDGDTYTIGTLDAFVMDTPGHTPACMTHVDRRCRLCRRYAVHAGRRHGPRRFPGRRREAALPVDQKSSELPPEMRLFMCHDYGPNGREIRWETTVAEERANNIHVRDGISEDDFVAMRSGARQDAWHAEADHSVDPGQHSCRAPAAA